MGPGICMKLFLPATDPKRQTSCLLWGAAPASPLCWECFHSTFPDTPSGDLHRVTVHPGPRPAQVLGGQGLALLWGFLHTYSCCCLPVPCHSAPKPTSTAANLVHPQGYGQELEAAGERSQGWLRVTQPAWGTPGSRVASNLHPPAFSTSESLPALSFRLQAAFQPQPSLGQLRNLN